MEGEEGDEGNWGRLKERGSLEEIEEEEFARKGGGRKEKEES